MTTVTRRQRQKDDLRQLILHAARDLFITEGLHQTSMRKIAERIDYSPTTIYLHFKDKMELMHELCNDTFTRMHERIEQAANSTDDSVEALRRGLRAYIKFGLENPHEYRLTLLEAYADILPEGYDHYLQYLEQNPDKCDRGFETFAYLRLNVQRAIFDGGLRQLDPELVAQSLWTAIHGVTSALIVCRNGFPFVDDDILIDTTIDALLKGFAPVRKGALHA